MYEVFMHTLRRFFGSGPLMLSMTVACALVVLTLVAWSSASFRQWCRGAARRGGWRAILTSIGQGLFKLLVIFVLARVAVVALDYQATLFEHEHGRITERNRSAVLMKWGRPQEQVELGVRFTRQRARVSRTIHLPGEKGRVIQQTYWKDEEPQLQPVDGQLPSVISRTEREQDVEVSQRAIESADIEITVRDNARELGKANYAGFDSLWHLKYVVMNRYDKPVTAHMGYLFPNCNKVKILVDGKDVTEETKKVDGGDQWDVAMVAGARSEVEISYEARGLEHLRYIPKRRVLTPHYRVAIHIEGISGDRLDFPIGSMPSEQKLNEISGSKYTLTWNLDNAITSLDIGIKLPRAEQPRYQYTRLLRAAPIGVLLLLLLLIMPRLIAGQTIRLAVIGVLVAAYYLFNTFAGSLGGLDLGFTAGLVISIVVLLVAVALFRLRDRAAMGAGLRDTFWFAVIVTLYSLAAIDESEWTGLWIQAGSIVLLVYLAALVVRHRILGTLRSGSAETCETD